MKRPSSSRRARRSRASNAAPRPSQTSPQAASTVPPITAERVRLNKQSGFNPIRQLQPDLLARQLDAFEAGNLREAALLWDIMQRRDDVLKSVIPKREKSVARRPYEILALDDSPEAKAHKASLEFFYNNLTATHALERNMTGGFQLLVRQMMDAVAKRYAAHWIRWQPSTEGLTAELHFVPLWFFENRTGQLRFLQQDHALDGVELDPTSWLVTYGDGLMEACSVAYVFKHMPLKDWLIYCERHGMPGFHGESSATKGSEQWNNMVEALRDIAAEFSCVTTLGEKINKLDTSTEGELPYPKIVERMDRVLAALWRGGDLSTLAKGNAVGSNPQDDEADILVEDDCALISETLQKLDRIVIQHQHGTDHPLAWLQLTAPKSQDTKLDLDIDKFLVDVGAPIAVDDALQRYGRPQPQPDAILLKPAPKPQIPLDPNAARDPLRAGNERRPAAEDPGLGKFLARARMRLGEVQAATLQPVRKALSEALQASDGDFLAAVQVVRNQLPALLAQVNADPATEKVWQEILGTSLLNGLAGATGAEKPSTHAT